MRRLLLGLMIGAVTLTACEGRVATAPAPPDDAVVGGEITVVLPRPASLDPGNLLDRTGEIVARTMCDPLVDFDRETGETVPAVIERFVVTDLGSRMVLRLRRGLRFPDGSKVTSRDVVFSLSRSASPEFAGESAHLLAGIAGYATLRGNADALEPRHRTEFAGIRLMSDEALEVTLDFPSQVVLPVFTHPITSVVSRSALEEDGTVMCVGPYQPVEPFDPDADTFVLERDPDYQGINEAYSGGGQGYLDRITFVWDDAVEVDDGRGVSVSVAPPQVFRDPTRADVVDLRVDDLGAARRASDRSVVSTAGPQMQYLAIPDTVAPVEVRLALSLALDREALGRTAVREAGLAATAFLPSVLGERTHDPEACPFLSRSGDPRAARELLAASGIDLRGQSIELVTNADFDNLDLVESVAAQWRRTFPGFRVEVTTMPWRDLRDVFEKAEAAPFAVRVSENVRTSSPDAWLRPFWTGSIGYNNAAGYANSLFDEIINLTTAYAIDPVDEAAEYARAVEMLCQDMPAIPLVEAQRHFSVDDRLSSVRPMADPVTGGIRLRELHLAE